MLAPPLSHNAQPPLNPLLKGLALCFFHEAIEAGRTQIADTASRLSTSVTFLTISHRRNKGTPHPWRVRENAP